MAFAIDTYAKKIKEFPNGNGLTPPANPAKDSYIKMVSGLNNLGQDQYMKVNAGKVNRSQSPTVSGILPGK